MKQPKASKGKNQLTVEEGAALIDVVAEGWMHGGKGSLYSLTVRTARKLSKNAVFNAAAWMKYSFGNALHGEDAKSWLQSARDLDRILS